ncbi:glycerophosphodiester phosphodiesterase [Streptomyces griseus]|uniref:glycerophosphodiester phosphodiesterase n=1 Tax=Streptomyces griseus TaxID=1911 RepID=UPI0004C96D44|nr:glycerophosphodiester phosphodiesterase [Streptomyces griseus]
MRSVTVVGHRGDPYRARENTLPSIASAFGRGADVVEVDVRLTQDRVPVLLHDDTLKRLWGHDRALSSLPHEEVRALTGGGVPTLREALLAAGAHRLMLDLPGGNEESVRRIVGAVREAGAGERVLYCAGAVAMLQVRAADPHAEIALTWTSLAPPRPVLLDAVRPKWLNYRFGLVGEALVERVHRDGLLVSAWTPDTRRSMRRLIANGVDSITTNRVDVLAAVLRKAPS